MPPAEMKYSGRWASFGVSAAIGWMPGADHVDGRGEQHTVEAEGPLAELLQHEIDHLDGVLAVDRATDLDPFCLNEEWNKHYSEKGRHGDPAPRYSPVVEVPQF